MLTALIIVSVLAVVGWVMVVFTLSCLRSEQEYREGLQIQRDSLREEICATHNRAGKDRTNYMRLCHALGGQDWESPEEILSRITPAWVARNITPPQVKGEDS